MSDTTPAPEGDPNDANQENQPGAGEDWQARYLGLQKVVAKRDEALRTERERLDALTAEHERISDEVAAYRQMKAAEVEEENARLQLEALKERFEPPPVPVGINPPAARTWTDPGAFEPSKKLGSEDPAPGFPV